MKFEELEVRPEVVRALSEEKIIEPNSIQQKTIPLIHEGKDVVGISRTGSGKTACFGIPLVEKMTKGKGVQGLVLAPTRELANQISNELSKWSKYLDLNVCTVFGGVEFDKQIYQMGRSEIVVATPGRLLDHMSRGNLDLGKLRCLILDEADKMVEMGFIEDVERIISGTPQTQQFLLFGATISSEVDYLKEKYMDDVVVAEDELYVKKDLLEQYYYSIPAHEKFSLLVHLLNKEEIKKSIIFCSKRSTVELVTTNLQKNGVKAEMIHGKMTQNKRLKVMEQFNNGTGGILVASAVAARGLDVKEVTHVFNYDLSNDPQEYVHRVGRTARAGEAGKAITLLAPQDHEAFYAIFDRYGIEANEMEKETFSKLRFDTGSFRQSNNNFRPRNGGYNRR